MAEPLTSCDTLFGGELSCLQHREGYRFSIDPVLLAHFVAVRPGEEILDLGAGCGVISLILLYRKARQITAITAFELQEGLVRLARANCSENHFQGQMRVVAGDLRSILDFLDPESFSSVVCNPPFYAHGCGRSSSNREAHIARHQVACTLAEVVYATALTVKNKGRVYFVYPAAGLVDLLGHLARRQLIVKRLQVVYSYPDPSKEARLVLVMAVKNGGQGVVVEPPLYVYARKNGSYSETMQQVYEPN